MEKIKPSQLKKVLEELLRRAAEQAFLVSLVLIFISLLFGGSLFYKYSILAEKKEPKISEEAIQFKEGLYQEILKEWQDREKTFQEAEAKIHSDLFKKNFGEVD